MIRMTWLGFGVIGAAFALFSGGVWWLAIVGGLVTVASVVLQYVDSKPFDVVIPKDKWVLDADGKGWTYQERSWRANGRVSISVFMQTSGRWEEVDAGNGIGDHPRFWVNQGNAGDPREFRVIAH
jgi:hypothetical protein